MATDGGSPVLTLRPTPAAAAAFQTAYDQAERDGEYELRLSLGDQLVVRQQLIARAEALPPGQLSDFEERADRIIELAFYGGMAVALAHVDTPLDRIEDAIARAQEWHP